MQHVEVLLYDVDSLIIFIIIVIIIGSTALGGPWPSIEALPIRLCRRRPSSNS